MAILKCKMCGGELELTADENICECTYCGTKQTVPRADNDKKITLFDRANRLRMKSEFDKATSVYENIVTEFPEEAEAYWGLCLCKYGIEYVDDPATGKKVPTCHRTSFEGIFKDTNFELAQEYSDGITRSMYREEAKEIDRLQKAILEIAQKEEPFDIFICYKETDENGGRTKDSVRAQEIYNELIKEGYKVFFSRITLEDKLGEAYEPYIFSALNSSKIMLAIGTSYDNYNAIWVKNEWSRFLQMMKEDTSKKLIPCYSDIDAYDMPEEFSNLQGQDMAKIGFLQDLLRGISKIMGKKTDQVLIVSSGPQSSSGVNISNLLRRAYISLEDHNWDKAIELFENVLNEDAENAEAYLGIALANGHMPRKESLQGVIRCKAFTDRNYYRAIQFASGELLEWLNGIENYRKDAEKRREEEQKNQELEQKRQEEKRREEDKKLFYPRMIQRRELLGAVKQLVSSDASHSVALRTDGRVVTAGHNVDGQCNVQNWTDIVEVVAGHSNTIGLKQDGTVVLSGYSKQGISNIRKWTDIVAVAAGYDHIVGLKANGQVVAVGKNEHGECNVSDWTDIVEIAAGGYHTVGIKSDGTVVATGQNSNGECNVSEWSNISLIDIGDSFIVGLKKDGTVVAVGDNSSGQCNVQNWSDIIEIAAGDDHTLGLKKDGTVIATGDNKYGQCNVKDWNNIIAITVSKNPIRKSVGIMIDGTVKAVGYNLEGDCNVSEWTNILAVHAGMGRTIGIKTNGWAVAVGDKAHCEEVETWKLFENPETVVNKQKQMKEKLQRKREEIHLKLQAEKDALNQELPTLKGLLAGKRRKEIEARILEIEKQLPKH